VAVQAVPGLVADVAAARRRVLDAVAGVTLEQEVFRPGPEEWAMPQVVEHMVLATHAGINMIWRAADGRRRGQPVWTGQGVHRGVPIEEVIAQTWEMTEPGPRTWKTAVNAPENVVPRTGGPLAYWAACLETSGPVLERLSEVLGGLDLHEVIYPHFLSGPLDAHHRLEFLRWHLDHHLQQIEDIKAAPGFPAAS
jgi:hypothetical protein